MSESLFDIEFHFPYSTIMLDKVEADALGRYSTRIHAGRTFTVRQGGTEYTINPAMMTYMEVKPYRPF